VEWLRAAVWTQRCWGFRSWPPGYYLENPRATAAGAFGSASVGGALRRRSRVVAGIR